MNIRRKVFSIGTSAALLASLLATVAAPAAFASTSVTNVGSIPRGGTSTTAVTFVFTENAVNSFPAGGGNLIVTIKDSLGGSTVHFSGTPTVTAPGSLGASVTVDSSGNFFTFSATATDIFSQQQITISGLKISADSGAALGAISATLTGSLAAGVIAATTTATGVLQASLGTGAATILVNVTSACGFDQTNANGQVNFSDVSDVRNITNDAARGTGLVNIGFAAGTSTHNLATTTITQTVPNCSTALASPGSVANVVGQSSSVTEQGNNPTTVNPGEQNQLAGTTSVAENAAGYVPVGTLTFTLSGPGIQFSTSPAVSSLTSQIAAPTGLTATASNGGSLAAATYFYQVSALGVNATNTGVAETAASAAASATLAAPGSITVAWTAVAGATGYNVYGRPATVGGTYGLIGTVGAGTTSYADLSATAVGAAPAGAGAFLPPPTGLTAALGVPAGTLGIGTRYYDVAAFDVAGQTIGSAPAQITITSGATNSVALNWNPVAGATAYAIYEAPTLATLNAAAGPQFWTPVGTATSFTDLGSGGTAGGTILTTSTAALAAPGGVVPTATSASGTLAAGPYFYVVTATNGAGETVISNEASPNPALSAAGSIALSWTAVVGATSYKIYRGTTAGGENQVVASGVTATSFTDIGAATVGGTPPGTNTTGGSATGATVLSSGLCNVSFDRTSCSVGVTTASTIPSTITLGPIMLDVASTVPTGTAVTVTVSSSPGINVNVSSNTIAYVARVAVGVADQPLIYINYNDQASGLIGITEQGPGFFVGGTGSDNTFGLCLATGESFTRAPYAVVTTGNLSLLNGLVGGASVLGTLFTDSMGNSCVYWTVYTASTIASKIEIRGSDSTGAVLPTGIDNGPRLSVPAASSPGTTQGVILIGTHTNVLAGIDVMSNGVIDVVDTGAFSSLVSMATRAFKSGVVVTALSQPFIPAGALGSLGGNLQIAETLFGQFKPGELVCVEVQPRASNYYNQDTYFQMSNTNNLPVITANTATSGLLVGPVMPGYNGNSESNSCYNDSNSQTNFNYADTRAFFSFNITQQAFAATLGVITISNIQFITTADAPNGPVILRVVGHNNSTVAVAFESFVSNAKIGTAPAGGNAGALTALGVTHAGPFTVSTKLPKVTKYVTYKFDFGTSAAGKHVGIFVATKSGATWSAFTALTTRIANSAGTVYYSIRQNSKTWKSFRAMVDGTWSLARQVRWI